MVAAAHACKTVGASRRMQLIHINRGKEQERGSQRIINVTTTRDINHVIIAIFFGGDVLFCPRAARHRLICGLVIPEHFNMSGGYTGDGPCDSDAKALLTRVSS